MKVEKLKKILQSLPSDQPIDVVTGEVWLPEQLLKAEVDKGLLFLQFDNAPDEAEDTFEGRGFVDHEIELIRERLAKIIEQSEGNEHLLDALTAFFLIGHETSSAEFVELLEHMNDTTTAPARPELENS
ncbi:hypothetical protein VTH8203_03913 [Vibrio thalassae]|uniref:Uncharacterized protein n=1 Tax=Vibrio thalassae TaxID=1243014 RepID=A0A240ENN2_9VIBR|nr:hypothetical protein [Vibrio thalassae]SNX50258.1 hypothetical protein VTH8203_03913 [Vibrio thalassae]